MQSQAHKTMMFSCKTSCSIKQTEVGTVCSTLSAHCSQYNEGRYGELSGLFCCCDNNYECNCNNKVWFEVSYFGKMQYVNDLSAFMKTHEGKKQR